MIEISGVWKIFGDNADAALAAIRAEGLGKAEVLSRFNAVVGVADVSLDVNRGEIFCVMGLSGSGKSTLVRHFNRLLEPTAGKIEIEGIDVMSLGTSELQAFRNRKIGMVFQNFALTADDVSSLAFEISANGRDPAEVAAEWVEANSDRVDAMLGL